MNLKIGDPVVIRVGVKYERYYAPRPQPKVELEGVVPIIELVNRPMNITAKPRKLSAKWTPDLSQDVSAYTNIGMDDWESDQIGILVEIVGVRAHVYIQERDAIFSCDLEDLELLDESIEIEKKFVPGLTTILAKTMADEIDNEIAKDLVPMMMRGK